jgi:hypothetical protein
MLPLRHLLRPHPPHFEQQIVEQTFLLLIFRTLPRNPSRFSRCILQGVAHHSISGLSIDPPSGGQ